MTLDFLNNPIVVSAFRVKYRKGGLFSLTVLYVMALAMGGMTLLYYDKLFLPEIPWPVKFFLGLMGIQFILSAIIAGSTTASSLKSEVTNRTMDFQRIAAISPQQILLGKLLGEPAVAYLLAIATVPLAVWCWLLGGVSFLVLLLVYVNLLASILLCGALGLVQKLEAPAGKATGSSSGAAWIVWVFLWVAVSNGWRMLANPWSAAVIGLLTPLPLFHGIYLQDVWHHNLPFFGMSIPFLLVTPITQTLLAWLCFHTMVRRLVHPIQPALSKKMGYFTLAVMDVLFAGALFTPGANSLPLSTRAAAFCMLHLAACAALLSSVTPRDETLQSWVWRFRGRLPWVKDLWLGERSDTRLVIVTFAMLGVGSLFLLLVGPALLGGEALAADTWSIIGSAVGMTVALVLALGVTYQVWEMLWSRSGTTVLVLFAVATACLHIAGAYFKSDLLLCLAPSAHYAGWLTSPPTSLDLTILLLLSVVATVFCWWLLQRLLRVRELDVDRQLVEMGVIRTA